MQVTRHYLTFPDPHGGELRIHYRRCGSGPPLLMVHQSPRSSREYETLMQQWGKHFTCIAPDTPGFGQSDPLNQPDPEIADYADALACFLDALRITPCAAYGFHSGGIICVTALKRHPHLFSGLALGGYAIWSDAEMAVLGDTYLPGFHASGYGEHLTWLWNRILEQSWFFPWFDARDSARLPNAHADPCKVHAIVMEMLDAGDHYRSGYGAVLRAPRDLPSTDEAVPPCLITAYDGDPLQAHIDRLGELPTNWDARRVSTSDEHQSESLTFLLKHAGNSVNEIPQDDNAGWLDLTEGLIHWRGTKGARHLILHQPGSELAEPAANGIAIDVPGHGLSSDFANFARTVKNCADDLKIEKIVWPRIPSGDPVKLYPELTPDRFGSHLARAWGIARAQTLFQPWYAADSEHAVCIKEDELKPDRIASHARALLRAGPNARRWHEALISSQSLTDDQNSVARCGVR